MSNCLFCIGQGIDDRVETWYAKLNLEPWDVFANKRYEENARHMKDPLRQTGRTVHGLLEAFALCVERGARALVVKEPVLRRAAFDLGRRLQLDIELLMTGRGVANHLVYEDHHHG